MTDFHSHILPGIDDGAQDEKMSTRMLIMSSRQGVDKIFATPHLYPESDSITAFLQSRSDAYRRLDTHLRSIKNVNPDITFPEIIPGCELYYFSHMGQSESLKHLCLGDTPLLLIEMPMEKWSDAELDDIEDIGKNSHLIPVIAHLDRYMRVMGDFELYKRVIGRKLLVQVNASFFTAPECKDVYPKLIENDLIHFIGSDCHNDTNRIPNMKDAFDALQHDGFSDFIEFYSKRCSSIFDTQHS